MKNNKYDILIVGGRLGMYKYFDTGDTIEAAFDLSNKVISNLKKNQ